MSMSDLTAKCVLIYPVFWKCIYCPIIFPLSSNTNKSSIYKCHGKFGGICLNFFYSHCKPVRIFVDDTFLVVDTFICITILYYNREEHSSRVILVRSLCNDKSSLMLVLGPQGSILGPRTLVFRVPVGTLTLVTSLSSYKVHISRVWVTGSSWGLPGGTRS